MNIKINYNECLTNLSCSIRKYYGLDYKHNTLDYIDKLLEQKSPENVVLILFDGMGSKILDRVLDNDSFLIQNKYKDITSVFPTTTTAATTSVLTGLDPVEHGWLGWNMYIKPIDKTITLFLNVEKGKEEVCEEFLKVKSKLYSKNIIDEINKTEKASAVKLLPFGENKYNNIDEMFDKIEDMVSKTGKKFIYAYSDEPDGTMHDLGPDSEEVRKLIIGINDKVEKLCSKLKNTIVFVIADHGQVKVNNIFIENYPDIYNMLERTTSLENRAISFKIKDGYKDKFVALFNQMFGKYFKLCGKEEVIKKNLFGYGQANELFEDAIGDFVAFASESNMALLTNGSTPLCGMHGGNSDEEVYIPLIIIDKC